MAMCALFVAAYLLIDLLLLSPVSIHCPLNLHIKVYLELLNVHYTVPYTAAVLISVENICKHLTAYIWHQNPERNADVAEPSYIYEINISKQMLYKTSNCGSVLFSRLILISYRVALVKVWCFASCPPLPLTVCRRPICMCCSNRFIIGQINKTTQWIT